MSAAWTRLVRLAAVVALLSLSWSEVTADEEPTPTPVRPAQPGPAAPGPAPAAPADAASGPTGIVLSAPIVDPPKIGANLQLGSFVGLTALDGSGTLFMALTDYPSDGVGSGPDKKTLLPIPNYTPSLVKLQLQDGQVHVLDRIRLKLPPGFADPVTGNEFITGLGNSERDGVPWTSNGAQQLAFDPNGVDSEGLVLDPRDGSFWISEEHGPSLLHVAPDGTILLRLVPNGLAIDAPGENVRDILPAAFAQRRQNRGFEGVGLSPDGSTLLTIVEAPLAIPNARSAEESRTLRLVRLDVSNPAEPKLTGMFIYLTESATRVGGDQADILVNDLAALSPTRALVPERGGSADFSHNMIYALDLSEATNLLEVDLSQFKFVEQLGEGTLPKVGLKPVAKSPLVNLAQAGYSPDHAEGLAIVDDHTLALSDDNEFGFAGFDPSGQPILTGAVSHLAIVHLEQPLR